MLAVRVGRGSEHIAPLVILAGRGGTGGLSRGRFVPRDRGQGNEGTKSAFADGVSGYLVLSLRWLISTWRGGCTLGVPACRTSDHVCGSEGLNVTLHARRIAYGVLLAAAAYCGWQWLFGARITEAQITSIIRAHLPVGADKAAVVHFIKSRGWSEWEDYSADPLCQGDPKDVEYRAESAISTGFPNVGPFGVFGHIQVQFAFDSHGRMIRFRTTQWYNGL